MHLFEQIFSSNIVLKEYVLLFSRLSQLCIKWVSMFDPDQTISTNILPYKQMFHRLATSANKACTSGEKQPIRN